MRAYEPLFFRCSPKISARWCSAPTVGKNPTCRFGASALPIRTDISPLLSWKSTASSDCRAIIPGLSVSEGTSLGPYLLNSRSAQAEWGKCTAQWIHAAAYSLGHGLCVPTNVVLNSLKREGRDRKGKIPGSLSQTLAVPPTLCRGHAFYLWFRDRTQEALALWRSPHGLEAGTDIPWSVPRRIAPARRDSQRTAFQGRAARRATIGIRYKGNPDRMFIWAHSAGNGPLGVYIGHPELHGPKGSGVKGAVFMSGNPVPGVTGPLAPVAGAPNPLADAGKACGVADGAGPNATAGAISGPSSVKTGGGARGGARGAQPADVATQAARSNLPGFKSTKVAIVLARAELDPGVSGDMLPSDIALRDEMCKAGN